MSSIYKNFQKKSIIKALSLDNYNYIINTINNKNIDISKDEEFQKTFDAFFKVRRDEKWRREYYNYFQKVKNNKDIKFEEILNHLKDSTGNIEASFSSKLLATINPNMPIWDQFVLKYYDIKIEDNNPKERIKDITEKYYEIIEKENEELQKEDIKEAIKQFREDFKEYNLSDIKILDFMIWSNRNK